METEEHALLPQKIDLGAALFIQFRRNMARSPLFIPLIVIVLFLFVIGFMHSTGIMPIHKLFDMSQDN